MTMDFNSTQLKSSPNFLNEILMQNKNVCYKMYANVSCLIALHCMPCAFTSADFRRKWTQDLFSPLLAIFCCFVFSSPIFFDEFQACQFYDPAPSS